MEVRKEYIVIVPCSLLKQADGRIPEVTLTLTQDEVYDLYHSLYNFLIDEGKL